MTRYLICLGLLLGAAGPLQVQAQTPPTTQTCIPGKGRFMGVIAKIDVAKQVLGLKTQSGKSIMVQATAKTKITVAGQPAKFSDLSVGSKARVKGKFDKKKKVVIAAGIATK